MYPYLDLVHDVEAVLVTLVRESDSDQRIHKTKGVTPRPFEGVAEVGTRVSDGGISSQYHKASNADTFESLSAGYTSSDMLRNLQDESADFDEADTIGEHE